MNGWLRVALMLLGASSLTLASFWLYGWFGAVTAAGVTGWAAWGNLTQSPDERGDDHQ